MATTQSSVFGTLCIRALGTWAILHGFLTMLGGIERWASPVYDTVKLLPGAPYSWGILLMIGGALALFASLKGSQFNIVFRPKGISVSRKPFKIRVIDKSINFSYTLIKNIGLWAIAGTCLLFSIGVWSAAYHPNVSLSSGDRDLLICILCVAMTKATEPVYRKKDDTNKNSV